jgi:hypothetical protein
MPIDPLESGLLKRVLVDSATGMPNTLYLEMLREWGRALAERRGEQVLLLRISVASGSERLRRAFGMTLFGVFRRADLVASEGGHRFHMLTVVREASDAELLVRRVRKIADMVNQRSPRESPLDVRVETAEE